MIGDIHDLLTEWLGNSHCLLVEHLSGLEIKLPQVVCEPSRVNQFLQDIFVGVRGVEWDLCLVLKQNLHRSIVPRVLCYVQRSLKLRHPFVVYNLVVVLVLLEQVWVDLLEVFENKCQQLVVLPNNLTVIERSSPVYDVVVQLQVEKVVLLLLVFIHTMDLVLDDKGHVAER